MENREHPKEYSPPNSLEELIQMWRSDLKEWSEDKSEAVAYSMVNRMTSSNHLDKWSQNALIDEIFELVSRLELPPHVYGDTPESRSNDWDRVRELVEEASRCEF